jgi:hypothetical protein
VFSMQTPVILKHEFLNDRIINIYEHFQIYIDIEI